MVWARISKERDPTGEYHMLKPRKIGHCEVLERFGPNACRIRLPHGWNIHNTFNISDLTSYAGEFALENSWSSSFLVGESDA